MAIIIRFVDSQWSICQRLVHMQLLAKSFTGEEIARELLSVIQGKYGIANDSLLAIMRDRASVTNLAILIVRVMYPQVLDIGCFSHTIDNAGKTFLTPVLDEFVSSWITLHSHSPKARLSWRSRTETSVKTYCKTRWWSSYKSTYYGDVKPFLEENDDLGPATRKKMLDVLENPQKNALLQLELAITVDAGLPFVQATYNLEGDGPLVLTCYEELNKLVYSIQLAHLPNLNRIAGILSQEQTTIKEQLVQYGSSCAQPVFSYFLTKFQVDLKPAVDAFKAARLFWPQKINDLNPDSEAIDSLRAFPFLQDQVLLSNLKAELPHYLVSTVDPLDWWSHHTETLPHWSATASLVMLVQPSSAAAERVFSLLTNTFSECQDASMLLSVLFFYNYTSIIISINCKSRWNCFKLI